ncbi:unnamed protein product [Adineta steineri]|uniref:F-box domain-containing protein n=2 Tax=Adineta steineri TaxID=433720 RepID=A0A819G9A3_9BILA|nr:unnamed protein product [Adineta steineri]
MTVSFQTLPVELFYRIFDKLDILTIIISCRNVCARLNAITDSYDRYQKIKTLDFHGNHLGYHEAYHLANALKNDKVTLTTLNLSNNSVGYQGTYYLAQILETNITLKILRLNRSSIGVAGAHFLANALKKNTNLTVLEIQQNKIDNDGTNYLADMLKYNKTLITLDLAQNHITDEGAEYLAVALRDNSTLKTLNLSNNRIQAKGIHSLANTLEINTSLTTLCFRCNRIDHEGAQYLAKALCTNKTLTTLDLTNNNIDNEGATYLANALENNTSFDTDESDYDNFDDDNSSIKKPPLPDNCQDEVQGIDYISACFMNRYNACPVFYRDSLDNACQEAFKSKIIKERRPVLLYIHHDWSTYTNVFCSNIFCSDTLIEYLLDNYIVWPWDITYESNRNKLIQIWEKLLPAGPLENYSLEQYPLLIGIMRKSSKESPWLSSSEYEWKSLLTRDRLTRTQEAVTRETLKQELETFNKECHDHEETLSFDFSARSGLCSKVMLEIVQYLSLNDIVNAFSSSILPLLYENETKVHISQTNTTFFNMVLWKIRPEQIVSLRLNPSLLFPEIPSFMLHSFSNLISLTLVNPMHAGEINKYAFYFPKLICLSLYYDNEADFLEIRSILSQIREPIKRFEIHCAGAFCTHYNGYELYQSSLQDWNVEYFLIEIGPLLLPSMSQCIQGCKSCFLATTLKFMNTMINIRHVRLITDKCNLDQFLDWNEWKTSTSNCKKLKTITVETWTHTSSGERYVEKAIEFYTCPQNHQTITD